MWALWPFGLGKAHRPPNAAPTLSLYEKEVSWQKSDLCGPPGEFQVEGEASHFRPYASCRPMKFHMRNGRKTRGVIHKEKKLVEKLVEMEF